MDAEGNVQVKQGERTVKGFAATFDRLAKVADLRKKASGGADVQRELFFAELDLGTLKADEIKQRADKLHLDEKDRASVDHYLVDAELNDLAARGRELGPTGMGDAVVKIAKAGRRPSEAGARMFWQVVLTWCSTNGEPALAQEAFDALAKMPGMPKQRLEEMLDKAKAAAKK